jgi:hypothetical protein
MSLEVGTIVTLRGHSRFWVAARRAPTSSGLPAQKLWTFSSRDAHGQLVSHTAPETTATVVASPLFPPSTELRWDLGTEFERDTVVVIADLGAVVRCALPRQRRAIGYHDVHVDLGVGESEIHKADLVLANLHRFLD